MSERRAFLRHGAFALSSLATSILSAQEPNPATSAAEQWYWYPGHNLTMNATGKETGNTCTWMLIENSPREGVPFHKHLYEDESFYVVSGRFEITVGERTIEGGPGTYLWGPRNVQHRWTNIGSERGRLLNVFAPSGIENYFLGVAIPIPDSRGKAVVDLAQFQARTAPAREKFGIIRTGTLKYPNG